jgi:hypothetical protein
VSPKSWGALIFLLAACGSTSSSPLPPDAAAPLDAALDLAVDRAPPDAAPPLDAAPVGACGATTAGNVRAGWGMPEPGARHFDVTNPDLVVDPTSHLTWQRTAAPDPLGWEEARSYCSCLVLAGQEDWRLPTRLELLTIVDYRRQDPSIDLTAFPGTANTWFWSASPVAGDDAVAWYLSFMDGNTHEGARDVLYGVRCVRGEVPAARPFTLAADTVTDPATGLTWQRAINPAARTWDAASAYCAGLSVAGGGWRLPGMAELQTLVDETVAGPAIDGAAFPATPGEGFWAGTPLAATPGSYWFVSFDRGIAYNAVASHEYNVRCVR